MPKMVSYIETNFIFLRLTSNQQDVPQMWDYYTGKHLHYNYSFIDLYITNMEKFVFTYTVGTKLLGRISDEHASFSDHSVADCGYLQRPQLAAFFGRSESVTVLRFGSHVHVGNIWSLLTDVNPSKADKQHKKEKIEQEDDLRLKSRSIWTIPHGDKDIPATYCLRVSLFYNNSID
ncbi:hypothetical protein AGLY_011117 [Aphis glycines]|uniref:Uncharacterized protein n=1 Tax=Aphis glycines TaxID=307491 RepID=A0A6G0TDG0_APHGL|nr:hypothetical protein AGLY_011117 [Aphis glycines]